MKLINIQTSDSEIVEVEWVAAQQSKIIRKMLDDLLTEENISGPPHNNEQKAASGHLPFPVLFSSARPD